MVLTNTVLAIDSEKVSGMTGASVTTDDVRADVFTTSVVDRTLVHICSVHAP